MAVVEERIVIERGRTDVWRFFVEPDNVPRYSTGVLTYERVAGEGSEVGARFRAVVEFAGQRQQFVAEVVDVTEGHRGVSKSVESPVAFTTEMRFVEVDDGTEVVWRQEANVSGLVGRLAAPLFMRFYAGQVRGNLERAKSLLEGE
jgi:carbon monoxide dehydrogenase subunit G